MFSAGVTARSLSSRAAHGFNTIHACYVHSISRYSRDHVLCPCAQVRQSQSTPPILRRTEVEKVVGMAGVKTRHLADESICSSDLCLAAAKDVLAALQWPADSIDALIMVTQSPDYLLPSTACLMHRDLGLHDGCAAFDVGLGCSGYPYGIWLAAMMLQAPGFKRALVLHGETPARFASHSDRSVALLFGDAGSATALEASDASCEGKWWFDLHTDGSGYDDLIIRGGGFRDRFPADREAHYVQMNGKNIFNFTIKRVPPLIDDTLAAARMTREQIDYYVFHQSNRFIMRHLAKKVGLPEEKTPSTIGEYGSTGGPVNPSDHHARRFEPPRRPRVAASRLGLRRGTLVGVRAVDPAASGRSQSPGI